mmetsp:Transcript_6248/g.7197  ORF Transcript_6248/g.7197 Transcript_6248/m.7197 type:complete len:211 (+) Transcript_6248:83-715(+)
MGWVTKIIILINVAVFIAQQIFGLKNIDVVSCLMPVMQGQFYRIITHAFAHINFMHIAFNMFWVILLSPLLEKHHRSINYAIIVAMLVNIIGCTELLINWLITLIPNGIYSSVGSFFGQSQSSSGAFYYTCPLGHSGIVYGYITLWAFLGDKYQSFFGFQVRRIFVPFAYLIVNTIVLPQASFIGHFSGILCALVFRFVCFDTSENLSSP